MLHLVGCYIAHRRRLGYQLNDASRLLAAFARFCARAAPGRPLTTDLALRWANERPGLKPKTRASRLSIVRGFARYCVALDPRTEVPATRLLCSNWQRGTPHIFTAEEVRLILQRARRLQTHCSPLHAQTYATLIGLIACTGIRPGEAIRLRLSDFDAHGEHFAHWALQIQSRANHCFARLMRASPAQLPPGASTHFSLWRQLFRGYSGTAIGATSGREGVPQTFRRYCVPWRLPGRAAL